ncbi:MAG TPA: DUF5752 family protein [Candidatus Acidoferrales bacterium]|nr:DUF5752 family protein [Candidatus Acidoferrales bacterium]
MAENATLKRSKEPFQLVVASYLIRIREERASTLAELGGAIRACSDSSIFYHTFQSLESHHYSAYSNDFAQWALVACNEAPLAERLAAVDLGEFVSIGDLREALAAAIEGHVRRYPENGSRAAFEPFYFCESDEVTVPTGRVARTLEGLAKAIRRMSLETLHYHFITSRLRIRLRTNDFSHWIEDNLGLADLARRLNEIDFRVNTLDEVRRKILLSMRPWLNQ